MRQKRGHAAGRGVDAGRRVAVNAGMSEKTAPGALPKWPFYVADGVLCVIAMFVLARQGSLDSTGDYVIAGICLATAALAAWISILPWLKEHDTQAAVAMTENLRASLDQIKQVQSVAGQIQQANLHWQGAQDAASRTVQAAQDIADRMKLEAEAFAKFVQNARDEQRGHLELEVEKLRRTEGDWLRTTVQMLDHVFALYQAGTRSGQPNLAAQLEQFQNACRDVVRRVGLVPYMPTPGEPFDSRGHQLPDPKAEVPAAARIQDVLMTGLTYQGQMLRKSVVLVAQANAAPEPQSGTEEAGEPLAGEESEPPSAQQELKLAS